MQYIDRSEGVAPTTPPGDGCFLEGEPGNEVGREVYMQYIDRPNEAVRIEKKIRDENITDRESLTSAILTGLGELGQSLGFLVYASPNAFANADGGEQGFDIAWMEKDTLIGDKDGKPEFVLVGESEWGTYEDVLKDFRKLSKDRTSFRFMFYDEDKAGDISSELLAHVQSGQKSPGDTYLLMIYPESVGPETWFLDPLTIVVDDTNNADIVYHEPICSSPNPPW